jgi:hypothetical protein
MKKVTLLTLAVVALVAVAFKVGNAQSKIASFRIVVEPSANGARATCIEGCAWQELTFSCDPSAQRPCKQQIDQFGVGPVK